VCGRRGPPPGGGRVGGGGGGGGGGGELGAVRCGVQSPLPEMFRIESHFASGTTGGAPPEFRSSLSMEGLPDKIIRPWDPPPPCHPGRTYGLCMGKEKVGVVACSQSFRERCDSSIQGSRLVEVETSVAAAQGTFSLACTLLLLVLQRAIKS